MNNKQSKAIYVKVNEDLYNVVTNNAAQNQVTVSEMLRPLIADTFGMPRESVLPNPNYGLNAYREKVKRLEAEIQALKQTIAILTRQDKVKVPDSENAKIAIKTEYPAFVDEYLTTKSRKREVCIPRQIFMYLMLKYTPMGCCAVAKMCGGRDHSTSLAAKKAIQDMIDTDKAFRKKMALIEARYKTLVEDGWIKSE